MFRGTYTYLKILSACLMPFVSACVVVPLGSEIDQGQIIEFHEGITYRSEVIEQIGEPNIFSGNGFDVYHLKQGQLVVMHFPTQQGREFANETYNLVFHYDANGLLKELRYEKYLDPNDPDLMLLNNNFTDRAKDFNADGEYSSAYISADGRLITAISETNIVIQEVEGASREIELEQMNLDSWGYGLDCVIDLHNHHREKQNPDFHWLIGIQDLRPIYRMCMTKAAFGTRERAYDVTADGSGLAVAHSNQLEILSQTGDVVPAPEADPAPILSIWFDGMENHVVTSSVEHEIRFMKDPLVKTEIKIRSLPSLNTVESIRRPFYVMATAMSSDNRLFALASRTHVELWRRIKAPGESPDSDGYYELTRVIPQRPGKGFPGTRLKFSPDGEYLMAVGSWGMPESFSAEKMALNYLLATGLGVAPALGSEDNRALNGRLYLWDTDDGRPVTEIAFLDGFIEATFNQSNEIVILGGQNTWAYSQNITGRKKYQSLKTWHLPLKTVNGNKGKTPSSEVVTPAIVATTDEVSSDIGITDTDIPDITSSSKKTASPKNSTLVSSITQKAGLSNGAENTPDGKNMPGDFDVSGTYVSEITTSRGDYFKKQHRKLEITLNQRGDKITGTNTANTAKLQGFITGDIIAFDFWSTDIGIANLIELRGEWVRNKNGTSFEGFWRNAQGTVTGTWNLTKIQ